MKCVYEELSEQECKCFCGGDKAMRSLGNSVGSIGASICNFLEYFGQMAQNSPTAYGYEQIMKQTDLQKENKKLKRINFILIIYVVISIVIQLYNILV